jgi:hypothetical protein
VEEQWHNGGQIWHARQLVWDAVAAVCGRRPGVMARAWQACEWLVLNDKNLYTMGKAGKT